MNNANKRVKRSLYLILAWATLGLSLVFAGATLLTLNVRFNVDATSVGTIYLGNKTDAEFRSYLTVEVNDWIDAAEYRIRYQNLDLAIDLNLFAFDVDATLATLVRDAVNDAVFVLDADDAATLQTAIESTFTATIIDHLEFESLVARILVDLEDLSQRKTYRLTDYLDDSADATILGTQVISGLNPADVAAIVAAAPEVGIAATSRFSLLGSLAATELNNLQLSILASGMEAVTAASHFTGFVFQSYTDVPSWAEIGMNVRVMIVNGLDFSFYNGLDYGLMFTVEAVAADTIRIRLIGYPYVAVYSAEMLLKTVVPFATVTITSGDERAGIDGAIYDCIRTTVLPGADPTIATIFSEERSPVDALILDGEGD
ncbi:MAG: hypothetical protein V1761_00440 [bacterium]